MKDHNVTVLVISTLEADKNFIINLSAENLYDSDNFGKDLAWKLAKRISDSSPKYSVKNPENSKILTPVLPDLNENLAESPEVLVTTRPENAETAENSGIIDLECVGDGFKVQVNPPAGFRGVAVVKGYQDDARCKAVSFCNFWC